ncbi:hypothetical protein HOL21_04345 [Candidatus Woesearchaeota archaeon]|jgi:hypothetical protein|nr:hypothetical protein [Candidatus Woesearchaeota archaeon]MBT5397417.1 hypothetical protein [Candidatus Woesearchaeota archaeon]MBT5924240.1 hypothetical protein [Candidatus Woesearchaeota archaeon]MBT7762817.1 hypothetical protein [Candidatus Woesearchaeota archaeon]
MARVRKNVYEELDKVKKLILVRFPEIEVRNWCSFLSKLAIYHYKKRKVMLLGKERQVYNHLIENSYNPYTVYRWALLERVPDEIRFQLKNHYLSQKKAASVAFQRKHETHTSLQIDIRQHGLRIVREM